MESDGVVLMLIRSDIERLPIADNSIDMIFTDPPYPLEFAHCYFWLAQEAMRVLKPGGFVLAMAAGLILNDIYKMFDYAGLTYFYEMQQKSNGAAPTVWFHKDGKAMPILARSKPIIAYSKGKALPRVGGMMNVFDAQNWTKEFHTWGQDVGTARYYIDCMSSPGDLILDPFIGGGTT